MSINFLKQFEFYFARYKQAINQFWAQQRDGHYFVSFIIEIN